MLKSCLSIIFVLAWLNLVLCLSHGNHKNSADICVIFGRPGCGKSTYADKIKSELQSECIVIDLDVCITKQMKDDFSKGIYPTSEQRIEFMNKACNYMDEILSGIDDDNIKYKIVAFSFVNNDIRNVFRKRFPLATWILVDTTDSLAQNRIDQRIGHFYKGAPSKSTSPEAKSTPPNQSNEWAFDDVEFSHISIDGSLDIETNVKRIKSILLGLEKQ